MIRCFLIFHTFGVVFLPNKKKKERDSKERQRLDDATSSIPTPHLGWEENDVIATEHHKAIAPTFHFLLHFHHILQRNISFDGFPRK